MNARRLSPAPADAAPAEDARQRLLHAALRLFALNGFAQTSTRELAEAANVNVAAISYYFGDKAGLYRAVFFDTMGEPEAGLQLMEAEGGDLAGGLRVFFAGFVEPLRQGDLAQLCTKLHFREMLEPTGLWAETVARDIRPMHEALLKLLLRQLGLPAADRELQRLAVNIAGMGVHMHVGRDITDQVAPGLFEGPQAVDEWADALVRYAVVLVGAEAERRGIELQGGAPA